MLPIVMAQHIHDGLADYLETTFPMTICMREHEHANKRH